MPELEEGNLWVRGFFPPNVSLEETGDKSRIARGLMQKYPEVELIACQMGRPDDGTDADGFYIAEFFVPLKQPQDWPVPPGRTRPRTKLELIREMNADLNRNVPGVDWNFSQAIRDMVMEVMSGVQGENSVKIFGPDLGELERTGEKVKQTLARIAGIENPAVYRIHGQSNFDLPIDRDKCALWNVNVADVQNVIQTAVGGKPFSQMVEGEKTFDITLRWPQRLRANEDRILDIPVDVTGHTVTAGSLPNLPPTPISGTSTGVSPTGTSAALPSLTGSIYNAPASGSPRRRLRDLLTASNGDGRLDGQQSFTQPGVSMIYREQGQRMVSVKFSVRGRDLAGTVAEAQVRVAPLLQSPYRAEWSGEFQEMGEAERRLLVIVPLALVLVFLLLYLAFKSLLDVFAVLSNVVAISMGGVWALWLTGTNFSVSAAVGFISICGVAVMDGLLLISSFNTLRAGGCRSAKPSCKGPASASGRL